MIVKILNNPAIRSDGTTGKRFSLVEAMYCFISLGGKTHYVTVPEGFSTDFASIPVIFRPLIPKLGKYNRSAILHDFLYSTALFSKSTSDKIFLEGMKSLGVKAWRRYAMYAAVKYFGTGAWNEHRRAEVTA